MDAEGEGLYGYLAPMDFRLLRITSDSLAANIGELLAVGLDSAPPYYAFSHSWGSQNCKVPIQIGQHTFFVCVDLAAGIRQLQELAGTATTLELLVQYVWIDTICINQENRLECSTQVRHMELIYTRAVRTLVWLGPAFESALVVWRLVDAIYSVFKAQHPTAKSLDEKPVKLFSHSSHAKTGLPDLDDDQWLCLKRLLAWRGSRGRGSCKKFCCRPRIRSFSTVSMSFPCTASSVLLPGCVATDMPACHRYPRKSST